MNAIVGVLNDRVVSIATVYLCKKVVDLISGSHDEDV